MALVLGETHIDEPGRPLIVITRVKVDTATRDSFTIRAVEDPSLVSFRDKSGTARTKATGTVTIADNNFDAGDGVTIAGLFYEFVDTPGAAREVDIGAAAADTASNLAAAINRSGSAGATTYHADTKKHPSVYATVSGAVVTLHALVPGVTGNSITVTETDGVGDDITLGGLSGGALSGGTGPSVSVEEDSNGEFNTVIIADGAVDDELEIVTIHGPGAKKNFTGTV